MGRARVRGIELHYEEYGSGSSHVVVAHGALGSLAHSLAFSLSAADLAAQGFHVIAYDARGHGSSGYSVRPEDYRPECLAEDMLGLFDALGLERASIYGASMGASTALMLARSYPDRVSRLVIKAPSPFGLDVRVARGQMHKLAWMYEWLGVSVTRLIGTLLSNPASRARTYALLSNQRRSAIVPAIRGFLAGPIDPSTVEGIRTPTLVLTHPGDSLHPLRSGDILRQHLPDSKLLVAPSRRHWDDDRGGLARTVAAWFRGEAIAGAA